MADDAVMGGYSPDYEDRPEAASTRALESLAASHWTSWPPMDDGPVLTDEEQIALVTAVRVQQVARIIARDTGASEESATTAAWSLASIGLLATPWRGDRSTLPGASA